MSTPPRVLVACEFSGTVRDAFIRAGCDAVSCDVLPTTAPGPHYRGNVLDILDDGWDLVVAFPPCTDLSAACAGYWQQKMQDGRIPKARDFFLRLYAAPAPRVAVENSVGWMNTNWRKPDQVINPYQFGHSWKKRTCLWLRNLPPLAPTHQVDRGGYWVASQRGRYKDGKRVLDTIATSDRYGAKRAKTRAVTFPGIAEAMAAQWAPLLKQKGGPPQQGGEATHVYRG